MPLVDCNPDLLRSSIERIGFAEARGPIEGPLLSALVDEAARARNSAVRACSDAAIAYSGHLARLRETSISFLTSAPVEGLLRAVFYDDFVLSEGSSCYTYYEAGDFLAAHKDESKGCEVTLLLYLEARSDDPDSRASGLILQIYEGNEEAPGEIAHAFRTRQGSMILGKGSQVWHGRPPLLDNERVTLLSACFARTASPRG